MEPWHGIDIGVFQHVNLAEIMNGNFLLDYLYCSAVNFEFCGQYSRILWSLQI